MPNRWPTFIIGILVGTAVLNGLLAYFAMQAPSEAVEPNPYERGLSYQHTIDALRAPHELGWSVELTAAPLGSTQKLTLILKDKQQNPISGAKVALNAMRPNDSTQDFQVALEEVAPGNYSISRAMQRGAWWLQFGIEHQGLNAAVRKSITVD